MSSVSMQQMNRNRNTMHMSTNAGDFPPQTKQEIAEQIRKSAALPLDEIWISGETEYPCLAILVHGADACLTYFETEGVMWLSYGAGQKPLSFIAGGAEWEAPADSVVSTERAIACMEAFFETRKRLACIAGQSL